MNHQERVDEPVAADKSHLARKLDAVGWGLFFIWVGIAFMAHLGLGVGLLGVGIITLAGQIARQALSLKLEGSWIVVGLLFVVAGLWSVLEARVALVPILLILVGLAWIISAVWRKSTPKE